MTRTKTLLMAGTAAVPLALAAWTVQAADITETLQERTEFSTLAHVLTQTGLDKAL